ncbi:MAG: diaminopimelate decarboxylase [Planctomycetota bacterium]
MDLFTYKQGALWCEDRPVRDLAAEFGTPLYLYSAGTARGHYDRLCAAFAALDPLICYSVKCCPNVHILRLLRACGSGFDVVSGGELHRALLAGAAPADIVFAGVGKTGRELEEALRAGVGLLNIESASEVAQLADSAARLGARADAAVRITPEVEARTHAYTQTGTRETKFGVPIDQTVALFQRYRDSASVRLRGLHLHIGSPVYDPQAYVAAITRALALRGELHRAGCAVDTLDIGGGFGARYEGDESPTADEYAAAIVPLLRGAGLRIILEPGRAIMANAGLLVARVLHVKDTGRRRFVIVDASMNELIRPALYSAYHFVWPVAPGPQRVPAGLAREQPFDGLLTCDVVGPVCESGDFLARERALPAVRPGDLLAVFTCGAYAMAMASQYNSRPRAAEVLVDGAAARLIRRRETYADLVAPEQIGSVGESRSEPRP